MSSKRKATEHLSDRDARILRRDSENLKSELRQSAQLLEEAKDTHERAIRAATAQITTLTKDLEDAREVLRMPMPVDMVSREVMDLALVARSRADASESHHVRYQTQMTALLVQAAKEEERRETMATEHMKLTAEVATLRQTVQQLQTQLSATVHPIVASMPIALARTTSSHSAIEVIDLSD